MRDETSGDPGYRIRPGISVDRGVHGGSKQGGQLRDVAESVDVKVGNQDHSPNGPQFHPSRPNRPIRAWLALPAIVVRDPRYGLTNHSNYAMPAHPGGGEA